MSHAWNRSVRTRPSFEGVTSNLLFTALETSTYQGGLAVIGRVGQRQGRYGVRFLFRICRASCSFASRI